MPSHSEDPSETALDIDEARHIARLARLELDPQQAPEIVEQLGAIVRYFDKLAACDTSAVEGRVDGQGSAYEDPLNLEGREEEDRPRDGLDRERILANAPKADGTHGPFYSVPEMTVSKARGPRRSEGR